MHPRPSLSSPESHPDRPRTALGLILATALILGAAACSGGGGEGDAVGTPPTAAPESAARDTGTGPGPGPGLGSEGENRPPEGHGDDPRQNAAAGFEKFDKDGNGYLRKEELPPDLRKDLKQLYQGRGPNDPGLSRDEFIEVVVRGPQHGGPDGGDGGPGGPGGGPGGGDGGPPSDPGAQFRMLDRNHDGVLRPDEFPPGQGKNFEELARSMGKDPSEGLTESEFVQGVSGHRGR